MSTKQYNTQLISKDIIINIKHLHSGNTSKNKRHGKPMVTIARVVSKDTGAVLSKGTAYCSKEDTPSRKIGRELAVGRALETYLRVY